MFKGLHHLHKRKRIHQKKEPYPHPDRWKRLMDRLIYIVGITGPLMTIPQVINVWAYRLTEGVSALSWSALGITAAFWLAYGFMHREKPIIVTYALWLIFNFSIAAGVLIY